MSGYKYDKKSIRLFNVDSQYKTPNHTCTFITNQGATLCEAHYTLSKVHNLVHNNTYDDLSHYHTCTCVPLNIRMMFILDFKLFLKTSFWNLGVFQI